MSDIEKVLGETLPHLEATLIGADGNPVNLLNADVQFVVKDDFNGENKINDSCSIANAQTGEIVYEWKSSDTDEAGYYNGKFRAVFGPETSDPDIQYFPNSGDITIEIDDQ
jgi:hypothetical protein